MILSKVFVFICTVLDVHVLKFNVPNTNMSGVIDINVTRKNKYGYQMRNVIHMTFTFEPELAVPKINMPAKIEEAASRLSSVTVLTDLKPLPPSISRSVKTLHHIKDPN